VDEVFSMKLIRRSLTLLLALLALCVAAQAADYKDVPQKHWARESIERATELGLIGGVGNGRFGMGRNITRAEYAMMLCRLMDWTMLAPETGSFTDNQDSSLWYFSAIETACANGALPRIGAAAGVTDVLTREELAAMTVRALGYAALAGVVQDECPFSDVTTNRGYITLAYRMGFMTGGKANAFSPDNPATREQAAAVLLRVYDAMHAEIAQESAAEAPEGAVAVEPMDERGGSFPVCPRAPLAAVYDAALRAGRGGAVALQTAAYNAATDKTLTPAELDSFLAGYGVRVYRSTRHESSYAARNNTVVWFEAEDDIAEKIALCRLLGVGTVYLIQ